VTLLVRASLREQCSVSCFLWAQRLGTDTFTVKCIQYFMRPAIHVCCTMFAHDQQDVVDEEDLSAQLFQRPLQ